MPALLLATLQSDPCGLLEFHRGNFICTPPGIAAGPYGTIVSGDLTDDWSPEIAAIQDGTLLVYTNPDSRNQVVEVDQGVLDVCFVPDSNGDSIPELLYTSNEGLKRVQYHAAQNDYGVELVDESALWLGAKKIRWFEEDVPAEEGLIRVGSNGRSFYRCLSATGGTFTEPAGPLFTLALGIDPLAEALDVELLEYDTANNDLEILLRHAYGFQVRRTDGSVAVGRAGNWPNGSVAAVRVMGETDSVAWVAQHTSGASSLLLFHASSATPQGPVPISLRTYGSMTGADVDADGDDDLVLGATRWEELLVLTNEPGDPAWFSNDSERMLTVVMSLEGATDEVDSMGEVLCANLFNEWSDAGLPLPGFAIALPGSNGLRLMPQFESTLYDEAPYEVVLETQNDFQRGSYQSASSRVECDPNPPVALNSRWTVTLGTGWGITANATHVQMIIGTSDSDVDPVYYTEAEFELASPTVNNVELFFDGLEGLADPEDTNVRYFVQVRPVKRDPVTNAVLRVWRWSILGMAANCDGVTWLASLSSVDPVEVQFETCFYDPSPLCAPPPEGLQHLTTRYVPSAVPQSRIPGPGPGVFQQGGP